MKWQYPRYGDRRTRIFFAWLPFSFNGTTYWLTKLHVGEVMGFYEEWYIEWVKEVEN